MKDLQTMVQHPSVRKGLRLKLRSGQPALLITEGDTKKLGQPLSSQQLVALLKSSLATEALGKMAWGRELDLSLDVGGDSLPVHVCLREDRTVEIELNLRSTATVPAPADPPSMPAVAEAPNPPAARVSVPMASPGAPTRTQNQDRRLKEILGMGMEALIVHEPQEDTAEVEDALEGLGYRPARTDDADLAMRILRCGSCRMWVLLTRDSPAKHPFFARAVVQPEDPSLRTLRVLIGDKLFTADPVCAFLHSVHLTVAREDVHQLTQEIPKTLEGLTRVDRLSE